MATVGEMLRRVQSFNAIQAASVAMIQNEQPLLDINRSQLYDKGIGKDGQQLPPYSTAYAKSKPSRGIVDIYKTGTLQKKMKLTIESGKYEVSSQVDYSPYVVNKRPTVYGFTTEGKRDAWFIIRPDFVKEFKEHTGLK
jgi:hypothetical protein